ADSGRTSDRWSWRPNLLVSVVGVTVQPRFWCLPTRCELSASRSLVVVGAGHWCGGSLSKSSPADGVAVHVCCMPLSAAVADVGVPSVEATAPYAGSC